MMNTSQYTPEVSHQIVIERPSKQEASLLHEEKEISRDAILNMISDFFANGISTLVLEGKADIGKTGLLRQFSRKYAGQSVSFFLHPQSWFLRDPSLFYSELAAQLQVFLGVLPATSGDNLDESAVRRLLLAVHRRNQLTRTVFYFVIDGLEDVKEQAGPLVAALIGILPLEFSSFRFLMSGDLKWLPAHSLSTLTHKAYALPGFSLEETSRYFEGFDIEASEVDELFRSLGNGTPGYLASARRMLAGGLPARQLVERLHDIVPHPFQLEWKSVEGSSDDLLEILAILAFDAAPHSIEELAAIVNIETSAAAEQLEGCTFVSVTPNETRSVYYVSASFRRFAASQLGLFRNRIFSKLAAYFLRLRDDHRAATLLPEYLKRADKPGELLNQLDASTFIQLAQSSDSFTVLADQSRLGFDTALLLKKYSDAIRFGISSGLVTDVPPLTGVKTEIAARLHLGEYEAAVQLAQTTVLKRHRLQLLAFIARLTKERGLTAETSILDALAHLTEQVSAAELGEDLASTAADLMFAAPDLGLKLVAKLDDSRGDDRSLDWALLRLSTLTDKSGKQPGDLATAVSDLRARHSDPEARNLSGAMSLLVEGLSGKEALKQAATFSSAGDQIFFLRHWCRHTRDFTDAFTVIDHAVYLSIRTTEYKPTARDYRDLASPLLRISDLSSRSSLITAFDIQKEASRSTGPVQDFVRMQLAIAEAEDEISAVRSGQRLLETYYQVGQIADAEIRSTCLAYIVASLPRLDTHGAFPDTRDLRELVEAELNDAINILLTSTADHYAVTRESIAALSVHRPDIACEIIHRLNYAIRRDNATFDYLGHLLSEPFKELSWQRLGDALTEFEDSELQGLAVEVFLRRIARYKAPVVGPENKACILKYVERAIEIVDPVIGCRALASALVFLAKAGERSSMLSKLKSELQSKWRSIDDYGIRRRTGFHALSVLADHNRELAQELKLEVEADRSHPDDLQGMMIQCVRLAIRAYSGLLPKRLDSKQDLERLTHSIEQVGARYFRTRLWADLALRFVRFERSDEGRRIVQTYLRPLLETLKAENKYDWLEALTNTSAALYMANPLDTLSMLEGIPLHWRTRAYESISRYKETGAPDGEPFLPGSRPYQLNYDACVDLVRLSSKLDSDYNIYGNVSSVVESVVWKHNKETFSQDQKSTLAGQIRTVAREQLPRASGISHEGYRVLVEAQAERLERPRKQQWENYIARGKAIANVSDRVFVLAHLSQYVGTKEGDLREVLLRDAHALIKTITATRDRVNRLRLLASLTVEADKPFSKVLLLEAAAEVKGLSEEGVERRGIVDLAYQVDPDWAVTIASQLDDDQGRKEARKRLQFQKMKEKLREPDRAFDSDEAIVITQLGAGCWDLLGQLNAGKISHREVHASMSLLQSVKHSSFDDIFPVVSFVIENAISRRGQADEAKVFVREMFAATLSACDLAQAIVQRTTGRSLAIASTVSGDRTLILAGERQKALDIITDWLRTKAQEKVFICDPFFGPKDLELIYLVLQANAKLAVTVVTSRKQQERDSVGSPYDDYYSSYWRHNFSDQAPPSTEIVVVGTPTGELPTHDRWIISETSGFRLGTSINSLGVGKDAELTALSLAEVDERKQETLAYVNRDKKEHLGKRLNFIFFDLVAS